MKTKLHMNRLEVNREKNTFKTESAWWYRLKQELNAQGHDLVKRIMSRDGHMVGDDHDPYYLRDRKGSYCFYDPNYALRLIHKPKIIRLFIEGSLK
jgi:hypothetical protein